MNLNFSGSTLRDYLRIVFRHKAITINTFLIIIISTVIGLELRTPVYQSHVKMLVSAEKQFESPYYKVLQGYQHLTQNEIVFSNPVIERAVKALRFQERPPDYDRLTTFAIVAAATGSKSVALMVNILVSFIGSTSIILFNFSTCRRKAYACFC